VAKADLLADLAGAVDKSIADGETLDAFRKRFGEIVQRHGWHGWTGEGTKAGEAWRTRIIYETNLSTSYAAGRLAQLKAADYPLWMYRHSDAVLNPRPQHQAWDGLTLSPDHDFWKTHYPPNGWGCACRVVGVVSARAAKRLGGDPDKQLPDGWDVRDSKGRLPGVDEGWDYAPGGTAVETVQKLAPKLETLPPQPSIAVIQDWLKTSAFSDWLAKPVGNWPLVRISEEHSAILRAKTTVGMLSPYTIEKQKKRHPELTVSEYLRAQEVVDAPTNWAHHGQDLVYVREIPASEETGGYALVVKATLDGEELFISTYYRLSRDEEVKDIEVQRLLRGRRKK
jgi:hypothetical protein